MKKIILLLVVFGVVLFSFAGYSQAEDVYAWTGDRTIIDLYPTSTHFVIILSGSKIVAEATCNNRFLISMDLPNYNALVATAMLKYTLGEVINVNYNQTQAAGVCSVPLNRFF